MVQWYNGTLYIVKGSGFREVTYECRAVPVHNNDEMNTLYEESARTMWDMLRVDGWRVERQKIHVVRTKWVHTHPVVVLILIVGAMEFSHRKLANIES